MWKNVSPNILHNSVCIHYFRKQVIYVLSVPNARTEVKSKALLWASALATSKSLPKQLKCVNLISLFEFYGKWLKCCLEVLNLILELLTLPCWLATEASNLNRKLWENLMIAWSLETSNLFQMAMEFGNPFVTGCTIQSA